MEIRGRFVVWLVAAAVLAGCGDKTKGGDDGSASPTPSPTPFPTPGSYQDNFVQRHDLPIPAPIPESLEVRALNDGSNTVLFCTSRKSLLVVDATNPQAMSLVTQVDGSMSAGANPRCQHLAFNDTDVVYIASRGDEIQPTPFITAFDFSGVVPQEIDTFTQAGSTFEGLAASGDMLYAGLHDEGLGIFQLIGNTLTLINTVTGFTNAWGVAVDGTTVYVADGGGGLAIVDASTPGTASIVGQVSIPGGFAQSVEIDTTTSTAYVAAGFAGLAAIDVSTPSAPTILDSFNTPGSALQVALSGSRAYLADWNDARVFDISDPSNLVQLATETIPVGGSFSRILGIGTTGDIAFMGEWTGFYSYEYLPAVSAPDVHASPGLTLEFGVVDVGSSDTLGVTLTNDGTEQLVIYDIATSSNEFTPSVDEIALAPNEVGFVDITFAPMTTLEIDEVLTLSSDDPDEPLHTIALAGNRPGAGIGDPAPEVTVDILGGGQWNLSQQGGSVVVLAYFATF